VKNNPERKNLAYHSIEVKFDWWKIILVACKKNLLPWLGWGRGLEEETKIRNRKQKVLFLVSGHLSEGLVQFVRNGLELLLFVNQFIWKSRHSLLDSFRKSSRGKLWSKISCKIIKGKKWVKVKSMGTWIQRLKAESLGFDFYQNMFFSQDSELKLLL